MPSTNGEHYMAINNLKKALEEMQAYYHGINTTVEILKQTLGLPREFHPDSHIVYFPKELESLFKDSNLIPEWIQFSVAVPRGEMLVVKRKPMNLWNIFDGPINFEP